MQKFCEQVVGKFDTHKFGQNFYFQIHVQIAITLSIFDEEMTVRQ